MADAIIGSAALEGCKRFYADPDNVKKFVEWKEKRDAGAKRQK